MSLADFLDDEAVSSAAADETITIDRVAEARMTAMTNAFLANPAEPEQREMFIRYLRTTICCCPAMEELYAPTLANCRGDYAGTEALMLATQEAYRGRSTRAISSTLWAHYLHYMLMVADISPFQKMVTARLIPLRMVAEMLVMNERFELQAASRQARHKELLSCFDL